MGHARIRSVRYKDGRAPLRVLHSERLNPGIHGSPENWNGKIVENARAIAEDDPIVGYVIVAVFENGAYNSASRIDPKRCPVPTTLWPAYVEEVVRRITVVRAEIDDE
ncbi:MAG TPA: hypothetical protein VJM31_02265 [Vicinamibacterales bacterium]|nr:hypothetical protein [Vicinamibacterales bacterium]